MIYDKGVKVSQVEKKNTVFNENMPEKIDTHMLKNERANTYFHQNYLKLCHKPTSRA